MSLGARRTERTVPVDREVRCWCCYKTGFRIPQSVTTERTVPFDREVRWWCCYKTGFRIPQSVTTERTVPFDREVRCWCCCKTGFHVACGVTNDTDSARWLWNQMHNCKGGGEGANPWADRSPWQSRHDETPREVVPGRPLSCQYLIPYRALLRLALSLINKVDRVIWLGRTVRASLQHRFVWRASMYSQFIGRASLYDEFIWRTAQVGRVYLKRKVTWRVYSKSHIVWRGYLKSQRLCEVCLQNGFCYTKFWPKSHLRTRIVRLVYLKSQSVWRVCFFRKSYEYYDYTWRAVEYDEFIWRAIECDEFSWRAGGKGGGGRGECSSPCHFSFGVQGP